MCDKCVEIDGRIAHYRILSSRVLDNATVDGIEKLIQQLVAEKAALYPEQERPLSA